MKPVVVIFTSLLPLALSAAGNQFQIEGQLFIDGKLVSSPRILAMDGEEAEISVTDGAQNEMTMKVVATELTNKTIKNGILMKLDLEYHSNGKTIRSSPRILAKGGAPATVLVESDDRKDAVVFKVVATPR